MTEKEKIPDLEKATEDANDRSGPHSMVETTLLDARTTYRRYLQKDRELYAGYQANVAMILLDRLGIRDQGVRNDTADAILSCIFGLKEKS